MAMPKNPRARNKVKCKCPICQKLHIQKIYWTGRGTPRKYCTDCLRAANAYSHHAPTIT